MGVSDRHHFAWLREALGRFERDTGRLAAMRRRGEPLALWGLGAQRLDPVLAQLREALGERAAAVCFDRFPEDKTVQRLDINALESLPDAGCDVLAMFRASYFIGAPAVFLAQARRILRPGGLAIVDWLHGLSNAPVLSLAGDPRHGATPTPFITTYADPVFLAEFPAAFDAFLRHVNRPPGWANVARPGAPLSAGERWRRLVGRGPRRHIRRETYLDALRADLGAAGKRLIEPGLMEQHFRVVFRDARYFYPLVRKFNLYLLTVLEPVRGPGT